ncbi:MAG TPA: YdeI/OmpD-associated family protein [Candidatus Limnocylindrales bacterium]|nr:YdeI/OmpD-associated family protein [Candidatus Limnocylindrales bacterium]
MARLEPHDVTFFESPAALRAWLEANHASAREKWVGMRPKATGLPSVTWEQVVDEVLCVGWIDGVRMRVEGGSCIRITPRRERSVWSARNVGRVEALRAEGRMRPEGEAAFARRREDRTAIYLYERENALDDEAEAALRADPAGWSFWQAQSPTYRRAGTSWVMSAKRPGTRAKRLAAIVDGCVRGERIAQLSPPGRARERETPSTA